MGRDASPRWSRVTRLGFDLLVPAVGALSPRRWAGIPSFGPEFVAPDPLPPLRASAGCTGTSIAKPAINAAATAARARGVGFGRSVAIMLYSLRVVEDAVPGPDIYARHPASAAAAPAHPVRSLRRSPACSRSRGIWLRYERTPPRRVHRSIDTSENHPSVGAVRKIALRDEGDQIRSEAAADRSDTPWTAPTSQLVIAALAGSASIEPRISASASRPPLPRST